MSTSSVLLMTLQVAALLLCSLLQQTVVAKEQYHEFVVITNIDDRSNYCLVIHLI